MDRYLVLENGMIFKGKALGAEGEVCAEIVFTTAMTGYLETLTDKSYTGQAVVQTFPLIGNYGVIPADAEGDSVGAAAYIVREACEHPSNFRSGGKLGDYLLKNGIVGLCGIDTRALTRVLRERGVMNGIITDNPAGSDLAALSRYRITRPVAAVSPKKIIRADAENSRFTVAMLDFGRKENILRSLLARGCSVVIFPFDASAEEILSYRPDGLFLTNGPGDPEDNPETIETLRELLLHRLPTMGICLGHQLLALAHGFATQKLKYGHRGSNQPVRCTAGGRIYITSQNHGYAVVSESISPADAEELFINVNDGTNEGLSYLHEPAFSVQFHPEACGGPQDTSFLFDNFIRLMEEQV